MLVYTDPVTSVVACVDELAVVSIKTLTRTKSRDSK